MLIFIAILTGLFINYITGGLAFNSLLCAFAGLFLIMPSLLKLKFSDFKDIIVYKKIFGFNILLNFIIVPYVFYMFGSIFFPNIYYIKYAFLLLGLLSSGGLVLSWVMKNEGNTKLAFMLFMINFLFFIVIFFPLNSLFISEAAKGKELIDSLNINAQMIHEIPAGGSDFVCVFETLKLPKCLSGFGTNISPFIAFFSIIIFPFIISRFVLLSKRLEETILSKIKYISSISTFFIISYIFSLSQIRTIFNFELVFVLKILGILSIIYFIVYTIGFIIYKYLFNSKEGISLFWVSTTRFVTLGLIFSFIYSSSFGYEFLLVFTLAYFIQIIFSQIFSSLIIATNKIKNNILN